MPNVVVTSHGLQSCISAHDGGPLVAVKFFLPVYDWRIDTSIHNGVSTSASAFSDIVDEYAETPYGEIIYNTSSADYSLTDIDDFYIISAGVESVVSSGANYIISNSIQSINRQINLHNGVPLQNHFSGSSMSHSDTGHKWTVSDYGTVVGSNNPSVDDDSKFFEVVDYYPSMSGTSELRGSFKCRLAKDIGKVKFNKIALYSVTYSGGVRTADPPVFFGEAYLSNVVYKEKLGAGFDDITIDVQIDIQSISADWAEVFFSSSADYWSRTPGGVYYPEKVGIGSFIEGVEEPAASLHVRRPRDESTNIQFRIDYNNSAYADQIVDEDNIYSLANVQIVGAETRANGIKILLGDLPLDRVIPYSYSRELWLGDPDERIFDRIYGNKLYTESLNANPEEGSGIITVEDVMRATFLSATHMSANDVTSWNVFANHDINAAHNIISPLAVLTDIYSDIIESLVGLFSTLVTTNLTVNNTFSANTVQANLIDVTTLSADHLYDADVTEGSFNVVFSGGQFSATQNITVYYKKEVNKFAGSPPMITLFFPTLLSESTSNALNDLTGIPSSLRPNNAVYKSMPVVSGGSVKPGAIQIDSSGNVRFGVFDADNIFDLSGFGVTGLKGFYAFAMTYPKFS